MKFYVDNDGDLGCSLEDDPEVLIHMTWTRGAAVVRNWEEYKEVQERALNSSLIRHAACRPIGHPELGEIQEITEEEAKERYEAFRKEVL